MVVLPCGAGKTLVGAAAMAEAKATTLILVTNTVAGRQWKRELIARTSLTEEEIGEYSGERKEIRPVTIATYQVLTTRRGGAFTHLDLFGARDWGLVVYDEVHLLPAPIFRFTADLQARRRLGLTATLVREDGREGDVFSPDRPQAVRRAVEGHRVAGLDRAGRVHRGAGHADRRRADGVRDGRARGALPDGGDRPHQAAGGPRAGRPAPGRPGAGDRRPTSTSCTSSASTSTRRSCRARPPTRSGSGSSTRSAPARCRTLVISKVGNFSIDLPEAAVAIQVSGTFGSRQEEAQRLGRVLRPKADGRQAHFYTVVVPGHHRHRVRRPPAALPRRAGLRVHDRRRRRRARPEAAERGLRGQ